MGQQCKAGTKERRIRASIYYKASICRQNEQYDTVCDIALGHLNSLVHHQLKLLLRLLHNQMFLKDKNKQSKKKSGKKRKILNIVLTLLPWELKYILVTLAFPACWKHTSCCGLVHSNIRTLPSCAPVRSKIKIDVHSLIPQYFIENYLIFTSKYDSLTILMDWM